ncbi:MAG: carboxylesterase family protein [Oscillospiraceae bacterium]|nr:carboxylesterase family protein [Oscillospiraceae bacterium]
MTDKKIGAALLQTGCGAVRGNEREDCLEFLGVPYGRAERFEYASAVDHWDGELDATAFGPACPQNRGWHEHMEDATFRFYKREFREGSQFTYSEDCLNLNVYAPKEAHNCPVVLFFHGGGFESGVNCESPFDGGELARRGIVTVFANYRLGPLGYLTHPEIQKRYGRDGNFGLDDQLTAIRWVKRHIGDFGGDGENITLLGQSAGAISIQYLCLNHANEGLFQRAAMMSGAGLFPRFALPRRAADTHAYWEEFIRDAGCKSFEELQNASLDAIFDAVETIRARRKDSTYNTMPVVDGWLIPKPVDRMIREAMKLDYLIGFTNTDLFAPVMARIGMNFAKKNNGFAYFFDLDSPGDDSRAFHSCDLRYIFGTLSNGWRPYGERDREVSGQLMDYLANFARCGDPNGDGLPRWERGGGKALRFTKSDTKMSYVNYLRLARNFLEKGDPKA